MHYGDNSLPEFLDHINRNRTDNRIENLRPATKQQNAFNKAAQKNSLLGVKGVSKKGGGFVAQATVNGTSKYLGYSSTIEGAKKLYDDFTKNIHGNFYYSSSKTNGDQNHVV
jgi:hypothetical protein